jgi:hypothetical protein
MYRSHYPAPGRAAYLLSVVLALLCCASEPMTAQQRPSATASGTLVLEGVVPEAAPQPITFRFQPTDLRRPFQMVIPVAPSGEFRLPNLPRARFHVVVKGAKYLAKQVVIDTSKGNVPDIKTLLYAGDANNDNFVDAFDLGLLITAFDSTPEEGHFISQADLNGDDAVDVFDLLLLLQNFDREGEW